MTVHRCALRPAQLLVAALCFVAVFANTTAGADHLKLGTEGI